jgi:hydroxyacylglutathione hydrolase
MRVVLIPLLADNYGYLLIDEATNEAAVIDPAEAEPVLARAGEEKVDLIAILNTHHHYDHTGGNLDLLRAKPELKVIGSREDGDKIPGITHSVGDGDAVAIGSLEGRVLFIPCHTRGHVAFHFGRALFTGDTLFAAGCGRFFEGTARDMYRALYDRLLGLPDDTLIYCGHEYTETNLEFAETLEPKNAALKAKLAEARALSRSDRPTIPTTLGEERTYNPFLRVRSAELRSSVARMRPDIDLDDPISVLSAVRSLKDEF